VNKQHTKLVEVCHSVLCLIQKYEKYEVEKKILKINMDLSEQSIIYHVEGLMSF
jgi:hypothetical protein